MISPERRIELMSRALALAAIPQKKVRPNPNVGCVIANSKGEIIGEGYHEYYGGPHAEVNAIGQVSDELLKEAHLFVTLEPCSHFGKTPPCADLIISKKIPYVYAAMEDPNPLVAGKGFEKLRHAGIEVIIGDCAAESERLNKRFIHQVRTGLPYVILKWAESKDGFIAPINTGNFVISGQESRVVSHQLRADEDAILIGYNTALLDNPSLSTRYVQGDNPIRVVIDEQGLLPNNLQVFYGEAPTIIIGKKRALPQNERKYEVKFIELPNYDFASILRALTEQKITSLIIEGGSTTLQSVIDDGLWNEAYVIKSKQLYINEGVPAPTLTQAEYISSTENEADIIEHFSKIPEERL